MSTMPAGWGLGGPDVEVKGDCDAWGHMCLRPGGLEADDLRCFVEHDPLRDEGNALAQQLRDLGVEVQHVSHSGLVHGFLGLNHVSEAAAEAGRDLFDRFGDLLRSRAAVSSH